MKADLLPTNPLSQLFMNLPPKSSAPSASSTQTSTQKLPQGTKIIGNYLLGTSFPIQARTSARARSERCILPCTSRPVKK